MHQGFAFLWLPGMTPCYITPDYRLVPLDLVGDVPCVKGNGLWRSVDGDRAELARITGVSLDGSTVSLSLDNFNPALPAPTEPQPAAAQQEAQPVPAEPAPTGKDESLEARKARLQAQRAALLEKRKQARGI